MGKQWKQYQTLFLGAPKSLQMVTAAMKLKDAQKMNIFLRTFDLYLIMDHTMDCKRFYFNCVLNMLINKSE